MAQPILEEAEKLLVINIRLVFTKWILLGWQILSALFYAQDSELYN